MYYELPGRSVEENRSWILQDSDPPGAHVDTPALNKSIEDTIEWRLKLWFPRDLKVQCNVYVVAQVNKKPLKVNQYIELKPHMNQRLSAVRLFIWLCQVQKHVKRSATKLQVQQHNTTQNGKPAINTLPSACNTKNVGLYIIGFGTCDWLEIFLTRT